MSTVYGVQLLVAFVRVLGDGSLVNDCRYKNEAVFQYFSILCTGFC